MRKLIALLFAITTLSASPALAMDPHQALDLAWTAERLSQEASVMASEARPRLRLHIADKASELSAQAWRLREVALWEARQPFHHEHAVREAFLHTQYMFEALQRNWSAVSPFITSSKFRQSWHRVRSTYFELMTRG